MIGLWRAMMMTYIFRPWFRTYIKSEQLHDRLTYCCWYTWIIEHEYADNLNAYCWRWERHCWHIAELPRRKGNRCENADDLSTLIGVPRWWCVRYLWSVCCFVWHVADTRHQIGLLIMYEFYTNTFMYSKAPLKRTQDVTDLQFGCVL